MKVISSSLREFHGHTQRVTDIAWSPHHDGRLVSVGYEAEAFVSLSVCLPLSVSLSLSGVLCPWITNDSKFCALDKNYNIRISSG